METEHRRHDRLLIARFAADDSYPGEVEQATALLAECSECADLAQDIRALSRSVAQLPAPARPRDFRITAEQADRMRGSWLERLMRRFAAPGLGTLRPVAGVALSIGLVMAVAGALPSFAPAGPVSEGAEQTMDSPSASQEPLQAAGDGGPTSTGGRAAPEGSATGAQGMEASPAEAAATGPPPADANALRASQDPANQTFENVYVRKQDSELQVGGSDETAATANSTRDLLTYGGLLIALASLGILLVAFVARRRFSDSLLR